MSKGSILTCETSVSLNNSNASVADQCLHANKVGVNKFEDTFLLKMYEVLNLDENEEESRIIAKDLLVNGRQALVRHRDKIVPVDFDRQMCAEGSSQLLEILKECVQQQWQKIPFAWFHTFCVQSGSKDDENGEYLRILTRTAEHGLKLLKECPVFSIVLQLVFEFDDETIDDDTIFNDIYQSFILDGLRKAFEKAAEHIVPQVMEQHLNDPASPLFLALREYFREHITSIFLQCQIDKRRNLLEIALDCLASDGWKSGFENIKIKKLIKPTHYKILMENVKQYPAIHFSSPLIVRHESSTLTNTTSSAESNIRTDPTVLSTSTNSYSFPTSLQLSLVSPTTTSLSQAQYSTFARLYPMMSSQTEADTVKKCVNLQEKIELSVFGQAGEFLYIDQDLQSITDSIVENFSESHNFPGLIENCLVPVMYLLKRHQNLIDFFICLSDSYSSKIDKSMSNIPKINMRMIIHILYMRCNMSLSRIIINLLSKRNAVPFIEPSLDESSYALVADIIHVWEYTLPTFLSFGIGHCQGKSSLLNTLFMCSFEQTTDSIYFQETIDIDFGYNFLPRRSLNIADTHGKMSKRLFQMLVNLFDGFIIQIEAEFLANNIDSLIDMLDETPPKKLCIIIVRDLSRRYHTDCRRFLEKQQHHRLQTTPIFILPNISDKENNQNRLSIKLLRDSIFDIVPQGCMCNRDYLIDEIQKLIPYEFKSNLNYMNNMSFNLKNQLIQSIEKTNDVSNYFPVYAKFERLCDEKQKLAKLSFYESTNEEIFTSRQLIYKMEQELECKASTEPGRIFDVFLNVLRSKETMATIDMLLTDLRQERNLLVSMNQTIEKASIERYLSLEVLWRNAIVCFPNQRDDVQRLILDKYTEYMRAGYPFEIIDGDNFHFPSSFLGEALKGFQDKRILVISIIGPQNSGKSTLLNYMFGTSFDVRDGRCTRGIYGSFVASNFSNFDYVMLIDTEGLMGTVRDDNEFDRRLVLFCLAVSHVVIINVIGEIDNTLKNMLTFCADTLKGIGVSKVPKPIVHLVLNQKADLNIENNGFAIDRILAEIKRLDLEETLLIDKDKCNALSSAFKKGRAINDTRLPDVIHTEPNFLKDVQKLCGKIIKSRTQSLTFYQDPFHDPVQWLNFANTIFDTLQKFSDLSYFRDVNERRQNSKMREYIQKKLVHMFSPTYTAQLCEETLDCTEEQIDSLLQTKKVKISDDLKDDLDKIHRTWMINDTIRDRSQQFLRAQINAMFIAIRSSAVMANEKRNMELLIRDGQGEIKRLIDETITTEGMTNESNAREKFHRMFTEKLTRIKQKFIPNDRLRQACKFIYSNYNIYEYDCLPDFQVLIAEHFNWLTECLNHSMSIIIRREQMQKRWTLFAYQQQSYVEEQPFDPDLKIPYSLEIINTLVFLNKDVLLRQFNNYCNTQIEAIMKAHEEACMNDVNSKAHKRSKIRRAFDFISFKYGLKESYIESNAETYHFQKHTRQRIKHQKPVMFNEHSFQDDEILLQMSNFFRWLTDEILVEIKDRQIDTNLIQKIVGFVHKLIKMINLELNPFNLVLSRHVNAVFHSCAVLLLTKSYYNEQENHFAQLLENLRKSEPEMRNYFVSMVVPNLSFDPDSAVSLTKQLRRQLLMDLTDGAQTIIRSTMQKHGHINRRYIQEICDGQLINAQPSWILDYIEKPNKIIEECFADIWKTIQVDINRILADQKLFHIGTLQDFSRCVKAILSAIKPMGGPATFVDKTFQPDTENTLSANENLKNKKRYMPIIVYYYLSGKPIPSKISAYGATYIINREIHNVFNSLAQHSPPSSQVIATTIAMRSFYDSISIGNLTVVLETLLNETIQLMEFFKTLSSTFDAFDKQDNYKRLLDKVRGCQEKCPCCNRPCDADHTLIKSIPGSEDNQHCCILGHALRAMNGYRFEITHEASLNMCEQMKDEQIVVVGPIRKRWSEFKKDHADWNFDSTMTIDELNRVHGKFLTVWSKIGPELCRKYDMKFVSTNVHLPMEQYAFHFILLLDGSGSMSGKPWVDLLSGVKAFLEGRMARTSFDHITIIVFSSDTLLAYFNETISNIDLSTITFPGKSTDFTRAFSTVYCAIQRTAELTLKSPSSASDNSTLPYVIIFMSDGQSSYPKKELTDLKAVYGALIKRFWTVALGNTKMNILEDINRQMDGFFVKIETSSDLLETYAEIART